MTTHVRPDAVSRRAFLGGAVAFGAGVALDRSLGGRVLARTNARPDRGAAGRVIVVGAGLAGLTAAFDLRTAGWDVVVLEARNRVGGRVHTIHHPFTDSLHAESGGESIDDNHDHIQELIKRLGLRTERRSTDRARNAVVYYQGHRYTEDEFAGLHGSAVGADYVRFGTASEKLATGIDPEHPEHATRAELLDRQSLTDFIDSLHLLPEARFLVELEQRSEYAADPKDVSLLFYAQQYAVTADVPDSAVETMRIHGGNSTLAEALAKRLGNVVRTSSPVTSIEYTNSSVTVHAAGRLYQGARLVLATPPFPLRRVHFSPRVPASVAAAIGGLDLGPAVKVLTQFPNRFWQQAGETGEVITDLPFSLSWDATDSYASQPGVITTFTTGNPALALGRMSDRQRVAEVHRQFSQASPAAAKFTAMPSATFAWRRERYTGGGYAAYRPGQFLDFFPVLRAGFGPVRFAGEHTETLAGYMESAVRSGQRVARELGARPTLAA